MKTKSLVIASVAITLGLLGFGCAGKSSTPGSSIGVSGPAVVSARTEPSTFELSSALLPTQYARVLADVKDFSGEVANVRLRFLQIPIDLPMRRITETIWQAMIPPEQLRRLAVSGQTMKYQAQVVATDDQGRVGVSRNPIEITVKAPAATG